MQTDGFPGEVGKDGCVPVPTGPGLGVTYDWDYIEKYSSSHRSHDASSSRPSNRMFPSLGFR